MQYNTIKLFMSQYFFILESENIELASIATSPLKARPQTMKSMTTMSVGSEFETSGFGTESLKKTGLTIKNKLSDSNPSLSQSGLLLSNMIERLSSPPLGKTAKLQQTIVSKQNDPTVSAPYPKHATVQPLDNFSWSKTYLQQLRVKVLKLFEKLAVMIPKFFIQTNYYMPQLIKFFIIYYQTCQTVDKLTQLRFCFLLFIFVFFCRL